MFFAKVIRRGFISLMDCCSTFKRCLSLNSLIIRNTILSIISIIAFIGICYSLGYLFDYIVQDHKNNLFTFWFNGLVMAIILVGAILIIISIITGITMMGIYCKRQWKQAQVNNESEQLIE